MREIVETTLGGFQKASSGAAFHADELDFVLPGARLAVSLQVGRAWSNNGALLAVLAAASAPDVDWALVAVPQTYKGASAGSPVIRQLQSLASACGIRLDLLGVGVQVY